ncbi:MAG: nucleotidyltransferase family protein, partial [Gemmatimonadaceae bacterium]
TARRRFTMLQSRPEHESRVAALVLAAGASSRLGSAKQLVVHRGQPLVRRAAAAAADAGTRRTIVVLGAHTGKIEPVLVDMPHVATVVNEQWRDGIASSIAAGVREALRFDADVDGVLITLVDQPFVDAPALRRLLDAFAHAHRVVAAEYATTIGVPAVIGREHFADLLALTGDTGAGQWMRARPERVHRVRLPDASVDIDTAEDAATLATIP